MRKNETKETIFCIVILALWGVAGYFIGGIIAFLTH